MILFRYRVHLIRKIEQLRKMADEKIDFRMECYKTKIPFHF